MSVTSEAPAPRRRFRLAALAHVLGTVVIFVGALAGGLALHLDTAPARRLIASVVEGVLGEVLEGDFEIEGIEAIEADAIEIHRFVAWSPGGAEVVRAEDIRLTSPWPKQVLAMLWSGDRGLILDHVRVERGSVGLELDGDRLGIARAFSPVGPSVPREEKPGPAFRFALRTVELGEVSVRGHVAPAVPLDAVIHRLRASLQTGPEGLVITVSRSAVEERALLGAVGRGTVDVDLRVPPAPAGASPRPMLTTSFVGSVGPVAFTSTFQLDGRRMRANVDVPRLGPTDLAPWVSPSPLARVVHARASLEGELPFLDVDGHIDVAPAPGEEPATIDVDGRLAAEDRVRVTATVVARRLDLRAFARDLPPSSLRARLRLATVVAGPDTAVAVHLDTAEGTVADAPIPVVEGRARVSRDGVDSWLRVAEPGAPFDAWIQAGPSGDVGFAVRGEARSLDRIPRLRPFLGRDLAGRAHVAAAGHWRGRALDVAVDAEARDLHHRPSGTTVVGAELTARLRGPPDGLRVEGRVRGGGLRAGERRLSSFSVSAIGPVERPSFRAVVIDDADRELVAKGILLPERATARQLEVSVDRGGTALRGKVDEVSARRGRLSVRGLDLEGLGGTIGGGLRVEGGELRGKLHAKNVDLAEVSKLVGLPKGTRGEIDLDVELTPTEGGRQGRAALSLRDASLLGLRGVSLEASADMEGDRVTPLVTLRIANPEAPEGQELPCTGAWADAVVGGDFSLAGPLLEAASWREARGRGSLALQRIRLGCLREAVEDRGLAKLPLAELAGVLSATAAFTLHGGGAWPSVESYALRTDGLVVEPADPAGKARLRSDRIDVAARGHLGPDHGLHLELALIDREHTSPLPFVSATLDTGDLASVAARRPGALRELPLHLEVRSGRQRVSRWAAIPAPFRDLLQGFTGEVDVDLFADGSLGDPSIALRFRTYDLAPADLPLADALDIDTDTVATFYGGSGRFDTEVVRGGRRIASLSAEIEDAFDAAARRGRVEAKLDALPLASIPGVGARGVDGEVSGHVRLEGLGDAPTFDVALEVPTLKVGPTVRFQGAKVIAKPMPGRPGTVSVQGALPLPGQVGGLLVTGYAGIRWRDELIPMPDPDKRAGLYLVASDFPLATAGPMLPPGVGRVGGRVDGEVRLVYQAGKDPDLDVDLVVKDGVLVLPGQELTAIGARISSAGPTIRVEDLTASADTGRARGWLVARRDGFTIADVTGTIAVAESEPVPLSLSGVPIGTASGTMILNAARDVDEDGVENVDVVVTMADLRVKLPPGANKSLQPLEEHPEVTISHPLSPPEAGEPDGNRQVTVTLGIAGARVESNILRLDFSTVPDHSITYRSLDGTVEGQLQFDDGELNLLGKRFEFDRGLVRMRPEDPGNPDVNVTAHWDSPDGITVFVDYVGPLQPINEDKIRFRSSPARPEREVISLVLLGEDVSGEDRAAALTQGVAAAQFNEVLGGIVPGLSASFGSSDDGYVSTTVSYRFSDRISAAATIEQGTGNTGGGTAASAGSNNTATERTTLSLDWRFAPNFLLRGSVGVGQGASSGLDLLFQFRY